MPTLNLSHPTARSTHHCMRCCGPIEPGQRYRRWKGSGDEWPGIATEVVCAGCAERVYGDVASRAKGRRARIGGMSASDDRVWVDGWTADGRRVRVEGPIYGATVTIDGREARQTKVPQVLRDGGTKRWYTDAGVVYHPPRLRRLDAPCKLDGEPLRPGPDDPTQRAGDR